MMADVKLCIGYWLLDIGNYLISRRKPLMFSLAEP